MYMDEINSPGAADEPTKVPKMPRNSKERAPRVYTCKRKLRKGAVQIYHVIYDPSTGKREHRAYETIQPLRGRIDLTRVKDVFDEATRQAVSLQDKLRKRHRGIEDSGDVAKRAHADFIGFMAKRAEERKNRGTRQTWYSVIGHLKDFAREHYGEERIPFQKLTRGLVESFVSYLNNRIEASTVHTYVVHVKTAIYDAMREDLLRKNPAIGIRIKVRKKVPIYLNRDELKAMARAPCERPDIKDAFIFGVYTGLRISDIRALEWKNIGNDELRIAMVRTGEYLAVPLHDEAKAILGRQPRSEERPNIFNLPAQPTVVHHLNRWAKAAGVQKHIGTHTARRTCTTMLLNAGVDPYTVSRILGHRSLAMVSRYAELLIETKAAAIKLLPSLG